MVAKISPLATCDIQLSGQCWCIFFDRFFWDHWTDLLHYNLQQSYPKLSKTCSLYEQLNHKKNEKAQLNRNDVRICMDLLGIWTKPQDQGFIFFFKCDIVFFFEFIWIKELGIMFLKCFRYLSQKMNSWLPISVLVPFWTRHGPYMKSPCGLTGEASEARLEAVKARPNGLFWGFIPISLCSNCAKAWVKGFRTVIYHSQPFILKSLIAFNWNFSPNLKRAEIGPSVLCSDVKFT